MPSKTKLQRHWQFYVGFILIGVVVGVLLGLSVSPVASIAVTSLTGAAAALIAGINSVDNKSASIVTPQGEPRALPIRVDPWPLVWLAIGLIFGVAGGLIARNQNLLGSGLSIELNQWQAEGYPRAEVAQRLYEARLPAPSPTSDARWMFAADITATTVLSAEITMWQESAGLARDEVARRLLAAKYPTNKPATDGASDAAASAGAKPASTPALGTLLYGITAHECDTLTRAVGEGETSGPEAFRKRVAETRFDALLSVTDDDILLQEFFAKLIGILCEPS